MGLKVGVIDHQEERKLYEEGWTKGLDRAEALHSVFTANGSHELGC